jgi:uncharacterized protein YndB with AHSA1/START domain
VANATESIAIERELVIAASPETVWELLVDPAKSGAWMGRQSWSEPHVGGAYRVEVIPGHIASGEYLEVEAPRRLVHTWGWEGNPDVPPGSSTVEYELLPEGNGTRVRLTHRGLPNAESIESHAHGWDHYLGRLAVAASGGDPGPDPWLTESPRQ